MPVSVYAATGPSVATRTFSVPATVPRYTLTPVTPAGGAFHVRLQDPFRMMTADASLDRGVSPDASMNVTTQKYVPAANVPPAACAAACKFDGTLALVTANGIARKSPNEMSISTSAVMRYASCARSSVTLTAVAAATSTA